MKTGWKENGGEKIGEKMSNECVWLGEEKREKLVEPVNTAFCTPYDSGPYSPIMLELLGPRPV